MMQSPNIFCCLVHEKLDVIADLVANLRTLDPSSHVLLYNNSGDPCLLDNPGFHDDPQVWVYPHPTRHSYGRLHGFMLDCMDWACRTLDFAFLTNVDSDQLLLHPGYSERLAALLAAHPGLGIVRSSPVTPSWPNANFPPPGAGRRCLNQPLRMALAEYSLWRPFLARHGDALSRFPQWSFWPGTVFSAAAARGILDLRERSLLLQSLLKRTRIFATEEVILPMLVDVVGLELVPTPFDETCLRYKARFAVRDLEESLTCPERFWMHPVPREINHPLRQRLRQCL